MRPALHERHQLVLRFIRDGNWEAAENTCSELTARHPEFMLGWYLAAQIAVRRTGMPEALELLERALALAPAHPPALLLKAQCLASQGRLTEAAACACAARQHAPPEAAFWDALGGVLSRAGEQRQALEAYEEAVRRSPGNARPIFNRAAVRRFLGDLEGAEADYDRVIAMSPADFEAYRHRADLREQTPGRNHVAELEAALAKHKPAWRGEMQLRYALAKELEDLGEHEKSFQHLKTGARLRREHMRYDVKTDVATLNWIREAFPGPAPAPSPAAPREKPIFIVGLPRAGSSLVERILDSHPRVTSGGELDAFARALVEAVRGGGARTLSRREMVARSAEVDFAALGQDYLGRVRAAGVSADCFVDKMPLNFLYCGLIRRALPLARIVHVSRTPLAACYAIHKTLFEDGYPFSYDLTELGQYYVAYRRLMAHWQRMLPGAIHEVSYEAMVADQLGETRRLLLHCGLEWDDACVDFHLNPNPTTTQSASQVRRPLFITSVSQWRHHETHLAGLRSQLTAAGIEVEQANA